MSLTPWRLESYLLLSFVPHPHMQQCTAVPTCFSKMPTNTITGSTRNLLVEQLLPNGALSSLATQIRNKRQYISFNNCNQEINLIEEPFSSIEERCTCHLTLYKIIQL